MNHRSTHIKLITALLFLAMVIFTPVAKNCHVVSHVDIETDGTAWSETCTLCSLEFPAFEETDNNPQINTVERKTCVYVPSIVGHLCDKTVNSLVIRGPPEA